jgi:hypothetical protein
MANGNRRQLRCCNIKEIRHHTLFVQRRRDFDPIDDAEALKTMSQNIGIFSPYKGQAHTIAEKLGEANAKSSREINSAMDTLSKCTCKYMQEA